MHHRTCVIFSSKMVNFIEVILEEVELHATLDVAPVDGDVVVSVSSALFMPEASGMHQLMHHNTSVDTAITKTDLLHPSCPANTAATSTALHDVDVASLIGSGEESYAGLFMVFLHSLCNNASLMAVKSARDDIWNDTIGPSSPAVLDGISARLAFC